MAIDRDLINKQIFNGTRPPLDGFVSPVVDGFKAGACGEWCKFNPTEAKKLYEEAGGYKGGPLTISVNGDAADTRRGPTPRATRSRTRWVSSASPR